MFLLIDTNNFYSKFWFGGKEAVIDIFLVFLKKAIRHFKADKYCCCIDAECSFRYDIYDQYKANREKKPEEYYETFELLKFNFKKLNVHYISSKSLEAEDTMNLFVKNNPTEQFIVLSGDKDCLLMYEYANVKIYNYDEGEFIERNFNKYEFEEKDLSKASEKFKMLLSLKGDAVDNIPGVKGISDKKAKKLIDKFENLTNLKRRLKKSSFLDNGDKEFQLVLKDQENLLLSEQLVTLFNGEWKTNLDKYFIKIRE